jgi:inhibitor of KinA sporulation pathway (predicted exonuclease)
MFATLPTHLLVVDVEATCDDDNRLPKTEMEIIEIGAVMTTSADFRPVGEFAAFVRPTRHPRLTPFCQRLTTIRQSDVDRAAGFAEVIADFKRWIYSFEEVAWGSWGDYDRAQFELDCSRHRVLNPMPHRHVNLKEQFSATQGIAKKLGMAKALEHAGLSLVGTHHRGIDDTRNIARLLPYVFGRSDMGDGTSLTRRSAEPA